MFANTVYDSLTTTEKARWMSLLQAIDHIDAYCIENKLNFDEVVYLKPIPIKHFIEDKHKQIEQYLKQEQEQKQQNMLIYSLQNKFIKNVQMLSLDRKHL